MQKHQSTTRKRKIREERNPACNRCREKKIKCDASRHNNKGCSRCARDGEQCIVPMERRMKSDRTLSEDIPTATRSNDLEWASRIPSCSPQGCESGQVREWPPLALHHQSPCGKSIIPEPTIPRSQISKTEARPRSIGHLHLEGRVIYDCFAEFTNHYAPLAPFLPSEPSPDSTYEELPLKFWAIVAIGSRRLESDPNLLAALSPYVESLALASLTANGSSLHTVIEALLLLATWPPCSHKPFFNGLCFIICSIITALSTQAGLHSCVQGVYPPRTADTSREATLWAYGVIIRQSAMVASGLPSAELLNSDHLMRTEDCCRQIPPSMLLRARLMVMVTRGQRVLSELGLEKSHQNHDRTLKSVISTVNSDIRSQKVFIQVSDPLDTLHYKIAQLHARSVALLLVDLNAGHLELAQAFDAAIETISCVESLKQSPYHITRYCPDNIFQAVVLASCILLKLLKSNPAEKFNTKDGTTAFLSAMSILSAEMAFSSSGGPDKSTPARVARILSQLWSHDKAFWDVQSCCFVQPLQIRSRLGASVILDCLSWWRRLYRAPEQAHLHGHQVNIRTNALSTNASSELNFNAPPSTTEMSSLNEEWPWDFTWDFTSDFGASL